ncbi:biotin transporter BioY [Thermococcus sp.]|uniref:biotin transporter BioY n=1 Tax=Thermococcus sp. TaxID=35749 RepID=UPI00260651AD|nr:biotin transporter BioY [Thermococcus sp.]
MNAREVALAGLFVALTAVSAQVQIPLGPVPFTLQVFGVILSGLLLGSRLGFISQALYILAGAIGLPVFAGFTGGFAHLYGPTGGYLLAFPIASLLAGLFAERSERVEAWLLGSILGIGVIYLLGWLRLGLYLNGDFGKALTVGVLPFVPFDIAKAVLAVGVAKAVKRALPWL